MSAAKVAIGDYLADLEHPLLDAVHIVRAALASGDPRLVEQVKWNAPSFSLAGTDIVTLMLRRRDEVLVIFHHPETPLLASPILEGDYPDGRRIVTLRSAAEASAVAAELTSIVRQLVERIDAPR